MIRAFFQVLFWSELALTLASATMPSSEAPSIVPWDKAEHFIAFYILAVSAAAAFPQRALVAIGLRLSGVGALIEIVQAIPALHRDCDVWDWVADTVAITAALAPVNLSRLREWIRSAHSKA